MIDEDLDSLLNVVESPTIKSSLSDQYDALVNDVKGFIADLNVKPAKNSILASTVYHAYVTWSKKPMTVNKFNRIFTNFFTKKRCPKGFFYYLDPTSFGLGPKYSMYTDPNFVELRKTQPSELYFGVYRIFHKGRKQWAARISLLDGSSKALGLYTSARAAAKAYDRAALSMYGNQAVVNFSDKWRRSGLYEEDKKEKT